MKSHRQPLARGVIIRSSLFFLLLVSLLGLQVGLVSAWAEEGGQATSTPAEQQNVPAAAPAPAPAQTAVTPPAAPSEYQIRSGDRIQMSIWGEPGVATDTLVGPDGDVSLPLIDRLHAAGKTAPALTLELQQAYLRYYKNPKIALSVVPRDPLQVYVEGNVGKPGPVQYAPARRVMDYLGLAGGPGPGADMAHIVVSTVEGVRKQTVDLSLSSPGPENNPTLQPGDSIWVGRTLPISVVGAVQKPGDFDYQPGLRLSDYLGMAGGPTNRARIGRATLKQTGADGKSRVRMVDLKAALKQPDQPELNPVLGPGDVVAVPEYFVGGTLEWSDIIRALGSIIIFW